MRQRDGVCPIVTINFGLIAYNKEKQNGIHIIKSNMYLHITIIVIYTMAYYPDLLLLEGFGMVGLIVVHYKLIEKDLHDYSLAWEYRE